MLNLGLIGLGYWGPNLARVLHQTQRCNFVACCDLAPEKLEKSLRQYPSVQRFTDPEAMWDCVDAVAIATPISTHFELAAHALRRGKHVFIEKPLAHNSEGGWRLVEMARSRHLTLMTGHTFLYSPPVLRIRELIASGMLGDLHYLSLSRVNLGLYQKDVDVIWDLAVHDVSILLYWLGEMPVASTWFGRACVQQHKNDVAFIGLRFPSGIIASIEISWLSPQKMRRTSVVGSRRMILYDDTEPSEKIKIYDRGVDVHPPHNFGEFQLTYRTGDMIAPHLANAEPLAAEIEDFIQCIETGTTPRSDGVFGLQVVRVLEMITDRRSVLDTEQAQVLAGSAV